MCKHKWLVITVFYASQIMAISVDKPVTFDNHGLGMYSKADFQTDWGIKPTTSFGQGERLEIVEETDNLNFHLLRVTYKASEVGGKSAMTFDAPLGAGYTHLFFQYKVKFASDFNWVKGGKLPGLTTSPDTPTGCISNDSFEGFSARYMWRENGLLYAYIYNPEKVENCGDYYVSIPNFYFQPGIWYTLKQEIFIGDPNIHNGYIKVWVNNQLVTEIDSIMLRKKSSTLIDAVKMDTFFGGSDISWAPSTDQHAFFNDFIVSTEDIKD